MQIFMSMSGTLSMFVNGKVTLEQLNDPETAFAFSCTRSYVLDDPERAPHEISWGVPGDWFGDDWKVAVADLPADRRTAWEQFRAAIDTADQSDRIWWGVGRREDQQVNPFLDSPADRESTFAAAAALRRQGYTVTFPAEGTTPVI